MSTDLVRGSTSHELALSAEQMDLVKRTICRGATDDELSLFLQASQRLGLDPFSKQIYAVKRWNKKAGREEMSIQVGIDGFRLVAQRSGRYAGQEGTWWCGADGQWSEIWTKGQPVAAKTVVLVVTGGVTVRCPAVAHWDEYADTRSHFWKGKPALMLAKCSEALALRKAFPQELSGFYTPDEMGAAGAPVGPDPAPPRDARDVVAALRAAMREHFVRPEAVNDLLTEFEAPDAPTLRERIASCDDLLLAAVVARIEQDAASVVDAEVVAVAAEGSAS